MIRFDCPCGKRLKVDDSYAGHAVECPYCGVRVEAPAAEAPEEPVLSGPDALVQAMRAVTQPVADEIPVAEVVADPGADPLQALAQAAKAGPARAASSTRVTTARPPTRTPLSATGKKPAGAAAKRGLPTNGKQPPAQPNQKQTILIAVGAAVLLVAIALLVSALVGGGGTTTQPKVEAPPVAPPAPPTPTKRERELHPPGELFPNVAPQS